ncbi:MAG: MFS transporter [Roseiflexaceae bacterium]
MEQTYISSTDMRRTLALACAVFLSAGITLSGVGPALPLLAQHIEQDIAVLGALFTAISLGIILTQFGAGPASARFGQPLVLAAGMLLMGSGGIGITFGRNLTSVLAGALLLGIGFGGILAAGNLLIGQLFSSRSAAALNGVNVFFGVGSMLGPAIAGLAGVRLGTPQIAIWVGAGLLLALIPIVVNFAARPPTPITKQPTKEHAQQRNSSWILALLLLIYIGTEVGFSGWLTVYLITGSSMAPASAALVVSGFWLALTLGRVLGVVLGLRLASAQLLIISLLGILIGALILVLGVSDRATSIAGVLLLGLSCGPVFPTALAIVATTARNSAATTSFVLAIGNCGGLIVPALLGVLLATYGSSAAAGLVLVAALTMLALCAAMLWAGAATRTDRTCEVPLA